MGSGTLCMGCISHMENPAPQARRGCRLSLPGQPGGLNPLLCALAASAACEGFLWEVIRSIMNDGFYRE